MPGMKGPKGARAAIEKPANGKETTKKLIKHYLIDYKWQLLIMLIFAVGSTVFTIVGPKILGNATTEIFNGIVGKISGGTGIDFSKVLGILLTLLGLYAISTFFGYIQGFTMTSVAQKLTYRLRNDVAVKINKLPMSFLTKKHMERFIYCNKRYRYAFTKLKSKYYTNHNFCLHYYRYFNNDVNH